MDDWREHAKRGDWQRVILYRLSDAEQAELFEMLKRIVPTRERGDGVETFDGFITPSEARSESEYEAALLAQQLERKRRPKGWPDEGQNPLQQAVDFAVSALVQRGIKYEGYRQTFVYWHPAKGRWLQAPGKFGAAIEAKRHNMTLSISEYPEGEQDSAIWRLVAWENLYPWRMCNSLQFLFWIDAFEPHTPF